MSLTWAIVLGVGRDQRLTGGADTAFLSLGNRPALAHAMCAAEACAEIAGMVVVVSPDRLEMPSAIAMRFGTAKFRSALAGGERRIGNLQRALEAVDPDAQWVAVFEAARPLVAGAVVSEMLRAAAKTGAAAGAELVTDPVCIQTGKTFKPLDGRSRLWILRGPRVYRVAVLRKALGLAAKRSPDAEDEIPWVEAAGAGVRPVALPRPHVKLRTADDLSMAALWSG